MLLATCGPAEKTVEAGDYQSFWLWPGIAARPELASASSLYILDGEIRVADPGRYVQLRAGHVAPLEVTLSPSASP